MMDSELIAFGLSSREAKIYLMLLKIGEAPASLIAKRCELPRLTAYSILERLVSKGLAGCYEKKNAHIYQVTSPDALLKRFDDEMLSLRSRREQLEALLPKLKSFRTGKSSEDHNFRLIRDRVLFHNLCVHALNHSPEWLVIHDGSLWQEIVSLRQETHKVPRLLVPSSEKSRLSRFAPDLPIHTLPDHSLRGPLNGMVVGSNVFFFLEIGSDFTVALLECPIISKQLRSLFWLLWEYGQG